MHLYQNRSWHLFGLSLFALEWKLKFNGNLNLNGTEENHKREYHRHVFVVQSFGERKFNTKLPEESTNEHFTG